MATILQPANSPETARRQNEANQQPNGGRLADKLLIAFFCGLLLVFGVATWLLPESKVSDDENRTLAEAPKLTKLRLKQVAQLPPQFEAFYSDRMAARTLMVKARNWLRFRLLGSAGSKDVAIGPNGWLYFLGDGSIPCIRHEKPFSQDEVNEWAAVLKFRTKLLADHGIKYYFVSAPNKDTIYPEFVPDGYKPIHPQSRLDQLSSVLENREDITFRNLAHDLLKHKGDSDIYYKTDSHWNERGAFIGYQTIIRDLSSWFPNLKAVDASQVYYDHKPYLTGDCVKLMGLKDWVKDDSPLARLKGTSLLDIKCLTPIDGSGKDLAHGGEKPIPILYDAPYKLDKCVLIHDSFGDGLRTFLAGHFKQIIEMRQDDLSLNADAIIEQHPDVVIHEVVERHVSQFTPWMKDWRAWSVATIQSHEPKSASVWFSIVPTTSEINVNRFLRVTRHNGCTIQATSPRVYTDKGDSVSFDPKTVPYIQWYLLKDGNQGVALNDEVSERNYKSLCQYIQTCGKFEKVDSLKLIDKSSLSLWRLK